MGFSEKLEGLRFSRRELMTESTKLGASISLLSLTKGARTPRELFSPASQELQRINTIKEIWRRENLSELLRSLETSYEQFGINADVARKYSGTVSFFSNIEKSLERHQVSVKSRRELFSALFSNRESVKKTDNLPLQNSTMVYSQFEPLQYLDGSDEEAVAQQYETARKEISNKRTPELIASIFNQQKIQSDSSNSEQTQTIIPSYVNLENRVEDSGPFIDPSIGRSGSELIRSFIATLAERYPGLDGMIPFVTGYEPRMGEGASATSGRGMMNIGNNAPLDQVLNPKLFLHEVGHLRPNEVLEKNIDLTGVVLPERLYHWDPRILIKTRTEINEIIAKLVNAVTQTEVESEGAVSDYSALHIHFSDQQWVAECTGEDEASLAQESTELFEFAQLQNTLPEAGKSPTMDLLRTEIGDTDAYLAQAIVLSNLHSDPKKMVGLKDILKKHPNSSVLQRWMMRIIEDIEHFIIDVNLNYCEIACTNSIDTISKKDLSGEGISIFERIQDPRAQAAFAHAQTCASLFRPYGKEKISYEEVATVPAELREIFENTVSNLLKNAGIVDEQAQASGYESLPQNMQCALLLSQVLYDNKEPVNLSPLIESNSAEVSLLHAYIEKLAPSVAASDSSQMTISFGQAAEIQRTQDQEEKRKSLERSLINTTISLLRMAYYPRSSDSTYPSFFFLKDIVDNLPPTLGIDEKSNQQLDTVKTITGTLNTMIDLAEKVGLLKIKLPRFSPDGIETMIELTHRAATPFLLGWDYESHTYDPEAVSALSSGLSSFQDSKEVMGVDFLPGPELQDVLRRTLTGDFANEVGQMIEEIRHACTEIRSNQSNVDSFIEQARESIALLRHGITGNPENDAASEEVRKYLESLTLFEETISTLEIVPSWSLSAAANLLSHRIQMAALGWVSPLPIDFNRQSSGNFHNQYLGARKEAVG